MRPSAPSLHPIAWGVLIAGLLLVGAVLLPADEGVRRPAPVDDRTAAITLLRDWDRDRADAWREGDPRALGRLYVTGSRVGLTDRAMLRAYVDRGLRVRGVRMQVASVRVARSMDSRVVVVVTDRLSAAATATGPGRALPLPRDRWTSRRIVLVRSGDRWQVARVTDQPRPAATTAQTSGSENS